MEPEIKRLTEKKLLGMRLNMSFTGNSTPELWRGFMSRRKEIMNNIGTDLYSVQVYPPGFFDRFDPGREFEKWAAIEVADFDTIPTGMAAFILTGGLYAVFEYKGTASAAEPFYTYIHSQWLPASAYCLDSRPHFEILGERYRNNHPDSEEEVWIPVRLK